MSDIPKEESNSPIEQKEEQNKDQEQGKKEENNKQEAEEKSEQKEEQEIKKEIDKEKEVEKIEDKKDEIKEEKEEDKKDEIKEEKDEEKNEDKIKDEKEEKKDEKIDEKKEEKEEDNGENNYEEDRKELYETIQDLKPDEASENIKSKLLILSDLHMDFKKVEDEQYGAEYDALQDIYDRKYQEIDDKITSIVNSKENINITPEEMDLYGIKDEGEPKEIEDYWEKVILNSRYFTITDKDKIILKYLNNVRKVKFPEKINDFRIDFYFKENEFFSNEILSKKYIYGKDALLTKAEGTKINWKSPDKNTTVEKVKKKIKKGKRFINEMKETKVDSFFCFFGQVDDMQFIQDEATFFKEDLFNNQLEYYMDIVTKTKHGAGDEDDEDDDYNKNEKEGNEENNDGKKEECKQQ